MSYLRWAREAALIAALIYILIDSGIALDLGRNVQEWCGGHAAEEKAG